MTGEQRGLQRQDFHISATEAGPIRQRDFVIEAILAFPELDVEGADTAAIPEFFHQMAADEGSGLKCRLPAIDPDRGRFARRRH